jgi:large subunit ribosomal protein L24
MSQKKLHVKKDDTVLVLAGKDKGKTGKVLKAMPAENRVIVESVNMIKKHQRPGRMGQDSGIIEREAPLNASNVMLVCSNCKEASRTGKKILEDGTKVRYCKKCGQTIDR